MGKWFGALILLAVAAVLLLLYRSSGELFSYLGPPSPITQQLVSAPFVPGAMADCPPGLERCRVLRQLPATETTWRIPRLLAQPGRCFYVTAFDTSGNESVPSNVVCVPDDYVPPNP